VRRTRGVLSFGFLLMGSSFTVTQGLLIREMLVAFFGNELSIGLFLGNWLILEAIGSGLLGRLADRWGGRAPSFAALQVLYALFLPLCLCAVCSSRTIVGAIPGEGVGLVPIYWASFLILAPLALVDGAMFAFGCRTYARLVREGASSGDEDLSPDEASSSDEASSGDEVAPTGEAASIGRVYRRGNRLYISFHHPSLFAASRARAGGSQSPGSGPGIGPWCCRGGSSSGRPGGRRWIRAASLVLVMGLLSRG
jgi:hypothetical protein